MCSWKRLGNGTSVPGGERQRLQSHKVFQGLKVYSHVNIASHIGDIGIVVIIG